MKNIDFEKLTAALAQARQAFSDPNELQSHAYNHLYRRVINLEQLEEIKKQQADH